MRPGNWLESLNCSIEGILWAVKTQRHMRSHFLAAVAVLLAALFFRVTPLEFVLLVFAVVLVLFAELVNTALETVVDLASPDYHELAKRAKDVAAGAVLVASLGAMVLGYLVLARYIFAPLDEGLGRLDRPPGELAVFSVVAICLLVVLLKARYGRGSPLHGGMPSGHAAVAASIATSILLAGVGPVIGVLAVALAVMVSHSRLLLEVHSLREVAVGILLGVGVTLGFYLLFGR